MDKDALRQRVWDRLESEGVARFPFPPHGRIPNFDGADEAADRLAGLDAWKTAEQVKCNPDSPQRPVRRRALEEGRVVLVAVPRLRDPECFFRLDGDRVDPAEASTIGGASKLGEPVPPEDVGPVDLVVAGSVAVDELGGRAGKGEGYSDLEFAVLAEVGRVDGSTPTATTVHEIQVVDGPVPVEDHDVPLDWVVTPERVVRTETPRAKPEGIDWDRLSAERTGEIPVLERFR